MTTNTTGNSTNTQRQPLSNEDQKLKSELLVDTIEHVNIRDDVNYEGLIDDYGKTANQARTIAKAAEVYKKGLNNGAKMMLTMAGSLVSAGLKHVILTAMEKNMVHVIVSTGANIIDQDFFEALGFKHYIASKEGRVDDDTLRRLHIDRIFDTYIDEDDLRVCDEAGYTFIEACFKPGAYSSRYILWKLGEYMDQKPEFEKTKYRSIIWNAYKKGIPIFVPALNDCSLVFGFLKSMHMRRLVGAQKITIDSAQDFYELTLVKDWAGKTGIVMLGGGVPKNFVQDIVVGVDVLHECDNNDAEVEMHEYAIQLSVAIEQDGALSGSTLSEAASWGKTSTANEQMVYTEITPMLPLLVGAVVQSKVWTYSTETRYADRLNEEFPLSFSEFPVVEAASA